MRSIYCIFFIITHANKIKALQDEEPDQGADCVNFLWLSFPSLQKRNYPLGGEKKKQNTHLAYSYMGSVKTKMKLLHIKHA